MLNFDGIKHINSVNKGDPFDPNNVYTTYKICKELKKHFPDTKIWILSHFTYEELLSEEYELTLDLYDYIDDIPYLVLSLIDVLVVKNQYLIDTQKSIRSPEVILYDS